jgi:RNA polymerase sigma-70 factor (ECF subfamily)
VDARGLTDAQLLERARDGDAGAYGLLVDRYADVAFRTALLICRDADEARDAAQEGFIRAHGALHRFRPDADLRPWLLSIVGNAARNRRRSVGRQAGLALRIGALPAGHAPSPEEDVVRDETRRELLAAVEGLRDEDRAVISLRWFAELSEEEVAAALGCPRGTVKSRLSRAMGRLRASLGEGDR